MSALVGNTVAKIQNDENSLGKYGIKIQLTDNQITKI